MTKTTSNVNIILGPPGTGKTTTLLNLVEENLRHGMQPNKIIFMSFTKKATEEAKERAKQRFNFSDDDIPYFRTIHSFAFRQLGMSPHSVMRFTNYKELGESMGLVITGKQNMDEGNLWGVEKGDRLLFIEGLSRVRCEDLHDTWESLEDSDISWWELDQLARALKQYKQVHGLIDYTDMLSKFYETGFVPNFELLFVDEAQDLSKLQWKIVHRLIESSPVSYIAGDDDQAIFRWSGADIDHFIGLQGNVQVLTKSYRIPTEVHAFAHNLIKGIENRREKLFAPAEHSGTVQFVTDLEELNLDIGYWLILVRNSYMLYSIQQYLRENGLFYSCKDSGPDKSDALLAARAWENLRVGKAVICDDIKLISAHTSFIKSKDIKSLDPNTMHSMTDLHTKCGLKTKAIWHEALDKINPDEREYFIAMLRRGEKLQKEPRIKVSTIHGSKGGEADNVCLFTDVSNKTYQAMQLSMEDETRVFYVGITRTKKNLHIVQPRTSMYFTL